MQPCGSSYLVLGGQDKDQKVLIDSYLLIPKMNLGSLKTLPLEILTNEILKWLEPIELIKLSWVCRSLREITTSDGN